MLQLFSQPFHPDGREKSAKSCEREVDGERGGEGEREREGEKGEGERVRGGGGGRVRTRELSAHVRSAPNHLVFPSFLSSLFFQNNSIQAIQIHYI